MKISKFFIIAGALAGGLILNHFIGGEQAEYSLSDLIASTLSILLIWLCLYTTAKWLSNIYTANYEEE